MKKLLSLLIIVSFMISGISVYAETDTKEIENTLITVKQKIDIPSELTEFESGMREHYKTGKTMYYFNWFDKERKSSLDISADSNGNIMNYNYYYDGLYDEKITFSDKTQNEYFDAAQEFLKSVVPVWFENEIDCLKPVDTENSIITNCNCTFRWERLKNGVPVSNQNASVTVFYNGEKFVINRADINMDYDAEFEDFSGEGLTSVREKYFEEYPIEKVYSPKWEYDSISRKSEPKYQLRYMFKDNQMGYISAVDGSKVEQDVEYYILGSGANGAMKEESTADSAISPEERAELDKISGIISTDDIVRKLREMNVLGNIPDADKFTKEIYKTKEGYKVYLYYSEEKEFISIGADGETGKIISFDRYDYSRSDDEKEMTEEEKENAKKIILDFLNKFYKEDFKQCEEPTDSAKTQYALQAYRLVNGVKALSDSINVTYDRTTQTIWRFNVSMTKDTSVFPSPEGSLDKESAEDAILDIAPLKTIYIKSNGVYKLCWRPDSDRILDIDAFTGKTEEYHKPSVYHYTDIDGHWAENQINRISEIGAGIPGVKFNPNNAITQKELLTMMYSAINYSVSSDDIYEHIKDIIVKDNINPESHVAREDAFVFMTSFMGLSKIASLNNIFKTDFADNINIDSEKIGSAAILRGYGIISGDGKSVRPKDNITNAETAVMIYNYLLCNVN